MAQRSRSRHRSNHDSRRQTSEMLNERAAALRRLTTLGDGPLRDALIDVAGKDSEVIARHPSLEYDETSRGGRVGSVALMQAAVIGNPELLEGGEPPADIVEAVGGLGTYYTLLEESAMGLDIGPTA